MVALHLYQQWLSSVSEELICEALICIPYAKEVNITSPKPSATFDLRNVALIGKLLDKRLRKTGNSG